MPPAPRRARSRYPPTCRGSPAASGSTTPPTRPRITTECQQHVARSREVQPPDSAVDDGGGDPGHMLRRPPEKLAGAVRALEVAMGVVLPGDADGAVHLDHLARHPGQR